MIDIMRTHPMIIIGGTLQRNPFFVPPAEFLQEFSQHASRTFKIHRLITAGTAEGKAIADVDTIDIDRAAFIKKYLKLNWPERHLYHAMFNTEMGDSHAADMLAYCAQQTT